MGLQLAGVRAWIALPAFLALLSGCGDDAPTGVDKSAVPTLFTGFVTDGFESGAMTMTVNRRHLAPGRPARRAGAGYVAVTATFVFRDTSRTVTGSWDDNADSLHLTGEGFVLTGHDGGSGNDPYLTGTMSFPGGAIGCWAAMSNANAQVTLRSGRWKHAVESDSGTVNLLEGSQLLMIGSWKRAGSAVHLELAGGLGLKGAIYFFGGDDQTAVINAEGVVPPSSNLAEGTWSGTSYDPAYGTSGSGTWFAVSLP